MITSRSKSGWKKVLLLIALSLHAGTSTAAEISIIAHPSAPDMNKDRITQIFLAKINSFPDGNRAVPLDLPEDDTLREQFYQSIANKNAQQLKAYWSRLLFTGAGQPPKILDDEEEILEFIRSEIYAIGYIDSADVDDSVKVLYTFSTEGSE